MLQIYYTLCHCYHRFYSRRSRDFQAGYRECLKMLNIGMSKYPQFNVCIENQQLEEDNHELRKQIKEKDRAFQKLADKLKEGSLFSKSPTKVFYKYELRTPQGGDFEIFTNMERETFMNMSTNFGARFQWDSVDEAKAMMMHYINSQSARGFKAYKDENVALKDGVKIKR